MLKSLFPLICKNDTIKKMNNLLSDFMETLLLAGQTKEDL